MVNGINSHMITRLRAYSNSLYIDNALHRLFPSPLGRGLVDLALLPLGFLNATVLTIRTIVGHFYGEGDIKEFSFAVCVIIKNEGRYLPEFISFHLAQGADKIIIYDNDSNDDVLAALSPFIDSGRIEYRQIHGKMRQLDAYNDAIRRHRHDYSAIAFIDADEFMVPSPDFKTARDSIKIFFESHHEASGMQVNWKIFGSSGYMRIEDRPALVTQAFKYRARDDFSSNKHTKSIVIPTKVLAFMNPHNAIYLPRCFALNTSGLKMAGPFCFPTYEYLSLHHYFCKSYGEFLEKRTRGKADALDIRPLKEFSEHDKNEVYDDSALQAIQRTVDEC
ncbi:glycosyltransferase family 92 protein [Collinsella sp. HCP28S3_E5]|uniref:glycosyltransferase family 92 protein n=1 Tax=Collinsella sp. HCP28S3_E5 TaxID=3438922 RepID=UPI003F8A3338